jgi:hypothetical protein
MRDLPLLRLAAVVLPIVLVSACSYDFGKLFLRDDPQVEEARAILDASARGLEADLPAARADLEQVLEFHCESDGGRDLVIDRPGASIDLGLVMFRTSELIGRRFGEEDVDSGTPEADEQLMAARVKELECAQLFLMKLETDPATDPKIALRARYLLGNFAFLSRRYTDAIARYDSVLTAHPARGTEPAEAGAPDDEDAIARAAAWNRAIALKRLEDQKPDAGSETPDSSPPDANDGGDSGDSGDSGDANDSGDSGGDGGGKDSSSDSGESADTGSNGGNDSGGPTDSGSEGQDAAAPAVPSVSPMPSSSTGVDLRELDRFDKQAPFDLDFKKKLEQKKKLPKNLDK